MSPLNSSTVLFILNFNTDRVINQLHVIYGSNFETVNSNNEKPPEICTELIKLFYFRSDYDNEDYITELDREWLSVEEIQQRQLL